MAKRRKYPPAYYKYQAEHPPVTIHINKKIKDALEKIRQERSYAEVLVDILKGDMDWEKSVKELPRNESIIMYRRGYHEAKERYAIWGKCKSCNLERPLTKVGICAECLEINEPEYSYFRDMTIAGFISDEDFKRAKVRMPDTQTLSYRNGMKRGYDNGYGDGYDKGYADGKGEAENEFKVTYNCSECGRPIILRQDSKEMYEVRIFLKSKGWIHGNHELQNKT